MTIKELESRTGLTRANIRFYEQEGLISPARLPNGYRDYTEADAETLEKIKLFRKLRLDLDTIRALQSGQTSLDEALSGQLQALEQDRAVVEAARRVCRQLREDRAEYATLNPRPYLDALEREPQEAPHVTPPPADHLPTAPYPWRRFFARSLDMALYLFPVTAFRLLVLHDFSIADQTFGAILLRWLLNLGLLFALEPLLLSRFGATPGKWILGLEVRARDGKNLSYSAAVERTGKLFHYGMGWMVAGWEWWRWWKSYKICKEGETLPWDEGLSYTIRDSQPWRAVSFVLLYAALPLLTALTAQQAMLPPNQGELTQAEYIENCNAVLRALRSPSQMNEAGELVYHQGILAFGSTPLNHEVILDGDTLTAVRLHTEASDEELIFWPEGTLIHTVFLALAGSRPEVNCLNLAMVDREAAQFWKRPLQELNRTIAGIDIRCEMELNGFYGGSSTALIPDEEAEEHFFSYTITFTLP